MDNPNLMIQALKQPQPSVDPIAELLQQQNQQDLSRFGNVLSENIEDRRGFEPWPYPSKESIDDGNNRFWDRADLEASRPSSDKMAIAAGINNILPPVQKDQARLSQPMLTTMPVPKPRPKVPTS